MNYIGITEDGYLFHYGVQGMKWGVRKNRGVRRMFRGRRRFDYTHYNQKTGDESIRSTRVTGHQKRLLKSMGYIDRHGDVKEGYEKKTKNWLLRRNIAKAAVATVVVGAAVMKGREHVKSKSK